MDHHVLVLAMSTLPTYVTKGMKETAYQLRKDDELVGQTFYGLGQLEVIPQFIQHTQDTTITDVIILETLETKAPVAYVNNDPVATCTTIAELYGGSKICMEGLREITHTEFFKRRMEWLGLSPRYESVEIHVEDPSEGLATLQRRIRELYAECLQSDGDWKLWLDTHGGFREVSMAMFGLMQMLAAPDEQELAGYSDNAGARDAIKRLSDGRDTIPVTGVYSIEFDPAHRNETQAILDRTGFYGTFTKPAVEAYMNYGQYAQMVLRSDAKNADGTIHPYSFISYRRLDAPKERYAFLGVMRKLGLHYWYDDDIQMQENWAERLVEANKDCSALIALVTKGYFASYQCVKELRQALDAQKLVILVSLDQTSLSEQNRDHVLSRHEGSAEVVRVSKDEMSAILAKQHLAIRDLIRDGCLQTSELEKRLLDLVKNEPETFGRTK